jgi:hypothetical protein
MKKSWHMLRQAQHDLVGVPAESCVFHWPNLYCHPGPVVGDIMKLIFVFLIG